MAFVASPFVNMIEFNDTNTGKTAVQYHATDVQLDMKLWLTD